MPNIAKAEQASSSWRARHCRFYRVEMSFMVIGSADPRPFDIACSRFHRAEMLKKYCCSSVTCWSEKTRHRVVNGVFQLAGGLRIDSVRNVHPIHRAAKFGRVSSIALM